MLHDTVLSYMSDIQEGHHEDVIRTFFRIRIADIGILIQRIPDITLKLAQATGGNTGEFIAEANRIVLVSCSLFHSFIRAVEVGIRIPLVFISLTFIIFVLHT